MNPASNFPPAVGNGANARRLLVIGDSISLGVSEVRGNEIIQTISPSYIDSLRTRFPGLTIDVDADVHRTSSYVREAIPALLEKYHPKVVLLMIGGNDADLDWRRFVLSDGKIARNRVPVDRYEKNLREIVAALTAAGATPILTDMPNHHYELRGEYISGLAGKDVTAWMQAGGGQSESDKRLLSYRASVARVAEDTGTSLVRYGEAMDDHNPADVIGVDGVHPAAPGHKIIAECLTPVLSKFFSPHLTELSA